MDYKASFSKGSSVFYPNTSYEDALRKAKEEGRHRNAYKLKFQRIVGSHPTKTEYYYCPNGRRWMRE